MDFVKTRKVRVAPIQDIDCTGFYRKIVEDVDLVNFSMSNDDDCRNAAPQIEESVELHGAFPFAGQGPREKREAKIDRLCIQSINCLVQLDAKGFVDVKFASFPNEHLSKVGVNAPVANLIGVGERISRDLSADAHVIEYLRGCSQTSLDVSQAFPIG